MCPVAAAPDPPVAQAENLTEAFRVFNRVSTQLADAYGALQSQVAMLTAELAAANGELRRQYQEKARLSERLALLLDTLPAGVVVLDRAAAVEQSNAQAQALLGIPLEGADWPRLCAGRFTATETPGEWTLASAGEARRIAVAETELDSAGGRIVLLHDVSATHAMQRQAERSQRLAAMGEMAAALAHQLRTPLAAALLYAANLARGELGDGERVQLADKAVRRLKDLERLISDMLIFARGEVSGREWFAAAALLGEATQLIEPLARERGIRLEAAHAGAQVFIHGDRKALAGSLINLLDNALQASRPGGRVALGAAVDGERLRLTVRDDGGGIDPRLRPRLFEPFFTTRANGTGLGLAIARAVAHAHGGSLELGGADGGGTEFVVELPCRSELPAAQPAGSGTWNVHA
jgi:two-component system sensor histidine kinase FlrB